MFMLFLSFVYYNIVGIIYKTRIRLWTSTWFSDMEMDFLLFQWILNWLLACNRQYYNRILLPKCNGKLKLEEINMDMTYWFGYIFSFYEEPCKSQCDYTQLMTMIEFAECISRNLHFCAQFNTQIPRMKNAFQRSLSMMNNQLMFVA